MTLLLAASERLRYLLLADGAPARCQGDLRGGVVDLRRELDGIKQFLASSYATNNNIINEDHFKKQIMQLAYEIEDAVESYTLKDKEISSSSSKGKSSLFCSLFRGSITTSFQKDLNNFKWRIYYLNSKLSTDAARGGGGGTSMVQSRDISDNIGGSLGNANTISIAAPQRHEQLETTSETRDQIVGMAEDVTLLKGRLLGQESKLSIITICGARGMGKTTLAKLLYHDPSIVSHFSCRAWANVGKEFEARDILKTILLCMFSAIGAKDELEGRATMDLMLYVYKMAKMMRYLIVLDDVPSSEAWNTISRAFSDDDIGRIIITTHSRYVAEKITTSSIHQMRMLNEDQSWELFHIKSGLHDLGVQLNPETEMIAKQVVCQCIGHPLSITAISNILRVKQLEDWDMVLNELKENPNLGTTEEILEFSYKQLPFRLKPCFLYLGHFPPNQDIPVDKLYSMWMAEGLISSADVNNYSRTEVAETYLNELIDRNLVIGVQMEDMPISSKFKSCQLHDFSRAYCLLKLKQEGSFEVIDFGLGNEIASKTSRVAIYLNKFKDRDDTHVINIPESNHIRSIHFFDTMDKESQTEPKWPIKFSDLEKFQWTRVLDFNGVDFRVKKIPKGIKSLVFLRYLSFQGCYLKELPSYLSNFRFLETLDLRVSSIMIIPNVLRKLSMLRHLYFPLEYQSGVLKLDSLINLEILENFHADICDADDLLQLEKLQILTCTVDGNDMDLKKIIDFLSDGKILRSSLVVRRFDSYSKKRLNIVAELFKCTALHSLDIEGRLGDFPNRESIGSNFTRMVFNGSELNVDPMPILGKLPKLKSLVFCNNAFIVEEMVCYESDFPQLTSLELVKITNLVLWDVKIGALPNLTNLTVEQCNKLRMLPDGLEKIPTLRKLMIGSMPKDFRDEVNKNIEERKAIGFWHGLDVTYYDC